MERVGRSQVSVGAWGIGLCGLMLVAILALYFVSIIGFLTELWKGPGPVWLAVACWLLFVIGAAMMTVDPKTRRYSSATLGFALLSLMLHLTGSVGSVWKLLSIPAAFLSALAYSLSQYRLAKDLDDGRLVRAVKRGFLLPIIGVAISLVGLGLTEVLEVESTLIEPLAVIILGVACPAALGAYLLLNTIALIVRLRSTGLSVVRESGE